MLLLPASISKPGWSQVWASFSRFRIDIINDKEGFPTTFSSVQWWCKCNIWRVHFTLKANSHPSEDARHRLGKFQATLKEKFDEKENMYLKF